MPAPSPASRSGDAPLRWRTIWGWGVFFALVIIGLLLFLRLGSPVPVLHEVAPPR